MRILIRSEVHFFSDFSVTFSLKNAVFSRSSKGWKGSDSDIAKHEISALKNSKFGAENRPKFIFVKLHKRLKKRLFSAKKTVSNAFKRLQKYEPNVNKKRKVYALYNVFLKAWCAKWTMMWMNVCATVTRCKNFLLNFVIYYI